MWSNAHVKILETEVRQCEGDWSYRRKLEASTNSNNLCVYPIKCIALRFYFRSMKIEIDSSCLSLSDTDAKVLWVALQMENEWAERGECDIISQKEDHHLNKVKTTQLREVFKGFEKKQKGGMVWS